MEIHTQNQTKIKVGLKENVYKNNSLKNNLPKIILITKLQRKKIGYTWLPAGVLPSLTTLTFLLVIPLTVLKSSSLPNKNCDHNFSSVRASYLVPSPKHENVCLV